ncbi:MAG TPA: HAMP domain-containing sensor histidine kinase [Vicinamibacterales bacterium]|nr:HAMP domain-containing sensor histidine kinase [Vicinamibacterales bacterium]
MPDASESIPLVRQDVDVGVLLEVATEVMQRQAAAHGVRLNIHIDDSVPTTVHVDRDKIAWAISSLIGSALRHVQGPGGLIIVGVSCDPQSRLAIAVRDNGPGIAAERLSKLLRRDAWRPGSALALLLVDDIATAHGGRLDVESKTDGLDHFTSVRMTIPLR